MENSRSEKQPIGIFDSGVGGLSVLAHIHRHLPNERLIYVADTAFMPYGCKTEQVVQSRCQRITDFFASQQCKAVVVACNTATAAAIHLLRATHHFPIIGMEPAIKPAIQHSQSKVIGILATSGTLGSEKFQRLNQRFASQATLIVQPCPGLVELIEQGELDCKTTRVMLQSFLHPLMQQGMDTLVLGCTHYPFVTALIREIIGHQVAIIDSGDAIARELERQLLGLPTPPLSQHRRSQQRGSVEFWSNGDIGHIEVFMSRLWNDVIQVKALSF